MSEYITNDTDLKSVADAIRTKTGKTDPLAFPTGFVSEITGIQTGGGGGGAANPNGITFYDYDGTVVTSWALDELSGKTSLPDYPTHDGLICQGWNWALENLKATNRAMNVGAMYITDDGKTRIYIHLEEGRTSPMLGCCPNGTVTVDWGDGTTPDTLTGTSTSTVKWTPNHNYTSAGDYVIKLTVDGMVGFSDTTTSVRPSYLIRFSSGTDNRNYVYSNSIQRIELGSGVIDIGTFAFAACCSLSSITIPDSVKSINYCAFRSCYSLSSITIPDSVKNISNGAFTFCYSLSSITIPDGITKIGESVLQNCYSLSSITIPDSVKSIDYYAFNYCYSLSSITIPDSVKSIGHDAFNYCYSLSSITIPGGVTSIDSNCFNNCYSVAFLDFTSHTAIPTLANTNALGNIAADCQIRVPSALADEWKAATNWSTYADYIVGV